MATKTRPSRVVVEIEKCRGNANWAKLEDLAKQLAYKSPSQEAFANFIQIEARLERHLLDNPEIGVKSVALSSLQKQLHECACANMKSELRNEVQLLEAKAFFASGRRADALSLLISCSLDKISLENIASRKLRLLADGYAIQGLCLEIESPSQDSSVHQRALQCFERAADLGLLQLQYRREAKALSQSGSTWNIQEVESNAAGPFIEIAIQKSPLLLMRSGKLSKGIARFRELLRTVELRSLHAPRQMLSRQLAEVLLRGVCETNYESIGVEASNTILPFKPKQYSGPGLFIPKNENEEALLLLLLSESIASREAVLDRSPEHAKTRTARFQNMTTIYDLMTILLVRQGQYRVLSEAFERAMKFSFGEFHIWYQFALSLISAQKFARAVLVLKECMRLDPKNATVSLQAAQICLHNLREIDAGIKYAKQVLDVEETHLRGKAYIACGIGYSMLAEQASLQSERQDYHRKALNIFLKAAEFDYNDHLAIFCVALQMAELRKLQEAERFVRRALQLRADHWPSLNLFVLLLTTQQRYSEALTVLDMAAKQYPSHISLLILKCKVQQVFSGIDAALQTGKHMLHVWKMHFEPLLDEVQHSAGQLNRTHSSTHRSAQQAFTLTPSDRDSSSLLAESLVAVSRIEKTLSEAASSIGSGAQMKSGSQQMWTVQSQIWIQLAELYLDADRQHSARACINEAVILQPVSHIISYMKGRLAEQEKNYDEAKNFYENAVAINPSHVKSLQKLAMLLHLRGNNRLAEKTLRDAVNADPTSPETWKSLGTVLNALGEHESAIDCLMTAVDVDRTTPIMPFSTVPKSMQG